MTIGRAFRRLTRVIRRLEEDGWDIVAVEFDEEFRDEDRTVSGAIDCQHPDVSRAAPGARELDLEDYQVRVEPRTVTRSSAALDVTLDVHVLPEAESDDRREVDESPDGPPLHQDRQRLARLYREHPTFDDMASAIPENVSAETVRRYMIEHGIHEPGRTGLPSEAEMPPPEVIADGLGLPGHAEWDELIDAVADASTVYDVQRHLDLDRDRTRTILQELELMDLVLGRLDDVDDREQREREIRQRLAPHLGGVAAT